MAGAPARPLVIDESLDTRLAAELGRRGRPAVGVAALGLRGRGDLDLLHGLEAQLPSWVLITADDRLPEDHGATLAALHGAVATIDPRRDPSWPLEAYRREVVHRWAHAMQAQPPGTTRRYGLTTRASWRPRRRGPQGAAR